MTSSIDLIELFNRTFGNKPYLVSSNGELSRSSGAGYTLPASGSSPIQELTASGSVLRKTYKGQSVLLPVSFYNAGGLAMELPYCVISLSSAKKIIETSLPGRKGTVKELYAGGDYQINIKGFLISDDRRFPESQLLQLRNLYEHSGPLFLENALTNIFLSEVGHPESNRRVIIKSLNFPEVTGGRENCRPFSMEVASDIVFVLERE